MLLSEQSLDHPLRFEPLFRRYLWGGRKLAEVLDKPIGSETAAESWEIVDHGGDQSVVAFGPWGGKTLAQLIAEQGEALLGRDLQERLSDPALPPQLRHRFPLLLKFLDANKHLSVQVHPDDSFGATLDPPDLGKTEAWYVVQADPGSKIYAGLKAGTSRESFAQAIEDGTSESLLHSFEPSNGDCVFIPAGTMHAIGAGLLIAEIQQASDTTFRVFDWGRVDSDGNSRELHVEQSLAATDFVRGPISPSQPIECVDDLGHAYTTVVACDKFVMNRHTTSDSISVGGDGRFRILAVTAGSVSVENDPSGAELSLGQTTLLPACLPKTRITATAGPAELLEIFVPG